MSKITPTAQWVMEMVREHFPSHRTPDRDGQIAKWTSSVPQTKNVQ